MALGCSMSQGASSAVGTESDRTPLPLRPRDDSTFNNRTKKDGFFKEGQADDVYK